MTLSPHVPTASADHLVAVVAGPVIAPADPTYDEARRVFNTGVDRRPAAIVRAAGTSDVVTAVRFAREHGLPLAVRSGGHSMAGFGTTEGGVVLDLSAMQDVAIDLRSRTAWAEGGTTAGHYTRTAARHGLATGFGDTATVGIAGLTLGGGIGWLVRKHGLTIDDLLAVELVTADGEQLRADADTHPDLFWALRGGGGNFGVVTRLQYRLHEVTTVLGGMLLLPAMPDHLQTVVTLAREAPDELSTIVHVGVAPPLPEVPAEHHGRLVMVVMLAYAGDVDAGERVVAPLRSIATPIVDAIRPLPYPELYEEEGPPPAPLTVRSSFLDDVDEATAAAVLTHLEAAPTPIAAAQFRVLGGAVARVQTDATAFAHRERGMLVNLAAASPEPGTQAARDAWIDGFLGALRPAASGAFVNFMVEEGHDRVREAYPGATYERLLAVKRRYDPANLFRLNQNVDPAR